MWTVKFFSVLVFSVLVFFVIISGALSSCLVSLIPLDGKENIASDMNEHFPREKQFPDVSELHTGRPHLHMACCPLPTETTLRPGLAGPAP